MRSVGGLAGCEASARRFGSRVVGAAFPLSARAWRRRLWHLQNASVHTASRRAVITANRQQPTTVSKMFPGLAPGHVYIAMDWCMLYLCVVKGCFAALQNSESDKVCEACFQCLLRCNLQGACKSLDSLHDHLREVWKSTLHGRERETATFSMSCFM